MQNREPMPVYLFTGFVEAGKTTFLQKTLEDRRFQTGERTLMILCEEGEVALLRQNYVSTTNYVCVAGIMKLGESAEETVIREVKEEIGQDVESLEFIKSYPYAKKEMLMLGYKATVQKKDFHLSGEVDSVEWVKLEDAPEKLREGGIAWQLVKTIIERS